MVEGKLIRMSEHRAFHKNCSNLLVRVIKGYSEELHLKLDANFAHCIVITLEEEKNYRD